MPPCHGRGWRPNGSFSGDARSMTPLCFGNCGRSGIRGFRHIVGSMRTAAPAWPTSPSTFATSDRSPDEPELAFELLQSTHGYGFATEAGQAVVAWATDSGHS